MLPDRYLAELTHSLELLEVLARQPQSTLESPVPACPGWTLNELCGHLGSIERWAAAVVRSGEQVQAAAPPKENAAAWFLDGIPQFLATMTSLNPAAPCWNFGPPPRTAGFWLRRQAHEHAIHLVDAHQASGLPDPEFAEDFLVDGIDEALAMFAPRQIRLERMADPGRAVAFRVHGGTTWIVGAGEIVASVAAVPQEMYLGLWGRSSLPDQAVIDGDTDLALRVIHGPLTP
ncbi:maleylpyruvate isomerase family mycothiol-dependent enzyme [Arthrobacter sp. NPDC057388]|uniref:maleylpyruvate isomerase family mycothiol-dependent enzyme n=1 Tax=Arthrobacter sp. NPDC057388 TaxID=3346116 RepID=UPI00363B88C3